MTKGELIVVTGPAAAGKSTVAKALQARFARTGELWLLIELDAFGRSTPRDWISLGAHRGRHAGRGFAYERASDGRLELKLGPDGRRVLAAFRHLITPHEAARIQGFPDWFDFAPPQLAVMRKNLAKWIGDAVHPALGYAVGLSVLAARVEAVPLSLKDAA
jgi:site-specific DNA-cytosine methylase